MKKGLVPNTFFFFVLIILILAFINRDQNIEIPVISGSDTQVPFTTGSLLEQTWQSNIKKICKISVPYASEADFEGEVKMEFVTDDEKEILADAVTNAVFKKGERGVLEFSLGSIDVLPGIRYQIRMQYTNFSGDGVVFLNANSNYKGCSINANVQDSAAGFLITGVKTSEFSFLVMVCFPFFAVSFLLMVFFRRKWEETIGISFILITLFMLIAGILGVLEKSIYFIYILAIAGFMVAIWLYNRRAFQLKDLFSSGLFVFVILLLFVIINCASLYVSRADEFTHWGLSVKDMFYYNSLTKHENTVVQHIYYPPFMPLIEYFFVYVNGLYSDRIVYMGCQIMLISCLIVSCKVTFNKIKILIPTMVVILAIPLIFYEEIFWTLYVDAALAVFIAYVLICYFSEQMSGFNFLRIIGGLAALTFTKPTGVVLAGLIVLIMLGDVVWKQKRQRFNCRQLIVPCVCMGGVCCFYLIWERYLQLPVKAAGSSVEAVGNLVESSGVGNITSASGITLKKLMDFLMMRSDKYRYEVLGKFLKTILVGDAFSIFNVSFSYLEILFLFFLISWLFGKGLNYPNEDKIYRFGILGVLSGLAYSTFLLVTYLFSFSQAEALILAHYSRYLGSWICGILLALFVLILEAVANDRERNGDSIKTNICLFLVALFIFSAPTEKLVERRSDTTHMEEYAYGYENVTEIARSFANRGESIYFVGEIDDYYMFAYAVCPLKVSFADSLVLPELSNWKEELKEYQYVFIMHADDAFNMKYRELFETTDKIQSASFYQVRLENNDIVLQFIGNTKAMKYRQEG